MSQKRNRVRQSSAICLAGMMFCSSIVGSDDTFVGMDEYIQAAMSRWEIPGLSIAVVKDGRIVLTRSYGVRVVGTATPVSNNTLFPIASCAKGMTAAAIGILVDEGKLNWDDRIIKHIPELELSDPVLTRRLTLRDLLSHRTGLQRCDMLSDRFSRAETLRRLKLIPVAADLRTKLTYSNPMQMVLVEIVERVSGKSLELFLKERIFQPLSMSSITFDSASIPNERFAPRHWNSDDGIVRRPRGRSVYSTAKDMARWLRLQLAMGESEGQRLVSRNSIQEMHALQFSIPIRWRPNRNIYVASVYGSGLGWFVQDYRGQKVVLHGGSWGAMTAMMPEQNLGVVVLSSLDLTSLPTLLMHDVFDAYLIGPTKTWNPDKWDNVWLKNFPPGNAYRPRDLAKQQLERVRVSGTQHSVPIGSYAGVYNSKLYGDLIIRLDEKELSVQFGEFNTRLAHWQDDSFYVRSPTRLTFDWLLTFDVSKHGKVESVKVKHVGWDKDERDTVFVRQ